MTTETTTPETTTASAPKAAPKAAAKAAKKVVKKAVTKATAYEIPDQVNKEIRWTDNKINLLKALKKVGAINKSDPKTCEEIAAKSGMGLAKVRHQCNPTFDLSMQGYIAISTSRDDVRAKCFFVTAKGLKKLEQLTAK